MKLQNAFVAGTIVIGSLTACGSPEEPAKTHYANSQPKNLERAVVAVQPGEVQFLPRVENTSDLGKELLRIVATDHSYPHGITDRNAPEISDKPMRLIDNFYPERNGTLQNDARCETLRVNNPRSVRKIAGIAIAGQNYDTTLSWPRTPEGKNSPYAYLCLFSEPGDTAGATSRGNEENTVPVSENEDREPWDNEGYVLYTHKIVKN